MRTLLYILGLLILLTSCQKENPEPYKNNFIDKEGYLDSVLNAQANPHAAGDTMTLRGKWTVVDGRMYVENIETHGQVYFDHFSSTRKKSCLRYQGGVYVVDSIEQNKTTYQFIVPKTIPNFGKFIMNDTIIFDLNCTRNYISIIELINSNVQQIGGSGIPLNFKVLSYKNETIVLTFMEHYFSENGYNMKGTNMITLKRLH